ncbi:WD40 repeat-like protein [Suillus weaverae]|nr:WD40 repeat-like protein [Suillus weaverae]
MAWLDSKIPEDFSRIHIPRSAVLRTPAPTMISKTPEITPHHTMRGHTRWVNGVVHLPGGRRTMTCSTDGSFRLWDLESGAQINEDWRDENNGGVWSMALSPNGKIVASGSNNGKVSLWNVKTRKVIAKWTGHAHVVGALSWSADGNQVLSGSWDGTARVWDVHVKNGKTVLTIRTGHKWVNAVIFSPDATNIATGGDKGNINICAVKIWSAKTGKLFNTLQHDDQVHSLAWTLDGKKLLSGSCGSIRIFDTATWQEIAILKGHKHFVHAISLSQDERLLASASLDKTALLWNLDTNLQVGPPLQHEHFVRCVALSADGKVLVTGCQNNNAYTWDIHPILKKAGLEDQLPNGTNIEASQGDSGIKRTPRSSLSDKSFLQADATRCHDDFGCVDELSPRFFDGMEANDSSPTGDANLHFSASTFLARLSLLLRRFRPNNFEATELPQPSTPSRLHPRVLFARLAAFIHRSPPENDAPNELQQPSAPSRLDLHVILASLSSLLPRSRPNTDGEIEHHPTTPSGLRPDALIDFLSSLFHSQLHANEEIELSQYSRHPHVVEVAAVRDRQVLYVAPRPRPRPHTQPNGTATPAQSRPIQWWAHAVLFLCCASPQHIDGNTQPTQQQQQQQCQPQGPAQPQASSSQTQPAAAARSTTSPAPATSPTPPNAPNVRSRPLPLRARFVLFLCCVSSPHADGH